MQLTTPEKQEVFRFLFEKNCAVAATDPLGMVDFVFCISEEDRHTELSNYVQTRLNAVTLQINLLGENKPETLARLQDEYNFLDTLKNKL